MFVRASSSLLSDDLTPATFWITFPNNTVEHNHAVGGTHFGFWYRMLEHPEGPSHDSNICPRNVEMGSFYNNTGHSLGWYMLWIFEIYHPKVGGCCNCEESTAAVFRGMKSWNNLRGTEFAECSSCQFHDVVSANNYMANIEMLELYHDPPIFNVTSGPGIVNAVLVSHFDYEGHPPATRRGLVLPFGHGLFINGICFDRFDGERNGITSSAIGLVKITCVCSQNCGAYKYRFSNVIWASRTQHKAYPEWPFMWQLEDVDGSLTGMRPVNGHYAHMVSMTPLYNSAKCRVSPEWSVHENEIDVDGALCEPGVDFAEFVMNAIQPSSLQSKPIVVINHYNIPFTVIWHVKNSNHYLMV